jgi:hypothetical protein
MAMGWGFNAKIAVLALALVLVGCAAITKGTTQNIAVDTPAQEV